MTAAGAWGRLPNTPAAQETTLLDRGAALPGSPAGAGPMLAHGLGRSYGDVALNDGGRLLRTRGLDRFIDFDRASGRLRAEAGVSLAEVLQLVMTQGWFLPVTPGTRHVTLGGALANDVHGKNHHRAGSFGHHVVAFELLRSDGSRRECRPDGEHADWFRATVGGLGLTGLVTWVEIQLTPIARPFVWAVQRRFGHLDDYWELDRTLGERHTYSVAWVDCLRGGRGIYSAAEFVGPGDDSHAPAAGVRRMPFTPPISPIHRATVGAFNWAYYHRPIRAQGVQPALPFFYPLDAIDGWNRLYGRRGFYQYQCVLPPPAMKQASRTIFERIGRSGEGSFLAVFKTFGDHPPAGLLSFPRAGATLALDFANRGASTLKLFDDLDAIVAEAGGALYAAKDARMSRRMFELGYPALPAFLPFVDPAFSSTFWRRITG